MRFACKTSRLTPGQQLAQRTNITTGCTMENRNDETDLPMARLYSQQTIDIANALGASRIVAIEDLPFGIDDSHDPLPEAMIMAVFKKMMEEIPDADMLTEEDELTEDYDRTLEDYFKSSEFQVDLFKLRWAV